MTSLDHLRGPVHESQLRVSTPDFTATADLGKIAALFDRAPRVVWTRMRDVFGAIFGSHRREFLARTKVKMEDMRAESPNSRAVTQSGFARARTFFYKVYPQQRSPQSGARPDLGAISGQSFTHSAVALGLERGGTFRAQGGDYLALPIGITLDSLGRPKSRWARPALFARGKNPKDLVVLRDFENPGEAPILFWKRRRGRGGRNVDFEPAFMLVRSVTRRPLLGFMRTWGELAGDRDRRLKEALRRTVAEIEAGREPRTAGAGA
jgi:hypothetical protein